MHTCTLACWNNERYYRFYVCALTSVNLSMTVFSYSCLVDNTAEFVKLSSLIGDQIIFFLILMLKFSFTQIDRFTSRNFNIYVRATSAESHNIPHFSINSRNCNTDHVCFPSGSVVAACQNLHSWKCLLKHFQQKIHCISIILEKFSNFFLVQK